MCWRAQPALACAPGEAHLLPAGHPLKWLGTGLQAAALAGASVHSPLAPWPLMGPRRGTLAHEEGVGGEAPLVLLSVTCLICQPLQRSLGDRGSWGQPGEMGAQLGLVNLTCP